MATVTQGYTWTSGETVTPAKLNTAAVPTVVVADGEVTMAKLAAAVQQLLVPAGAVQAFAMNSAPTGWLAADGTAVSRSTYASLFSAVGTTYGAGDGSTTFALPDLRGIFVRGSGSQTISAVTYSGAALGGKQGDSFRTHTHTGTTESSGNHTHVSFGGSGINGGRYGFVETGIAANNIQYAANQDGRGSYVQTAGAHTHTITTSATGADETRPANITLLYCIKF